ncbi:hypothetical protein K490DRAFT_62570 [Saccharata proteae CBS 121410]|uniref:Uncharacterized protein n=1 Tax=Saccharata proteae CBS 121410 TaxID=1314787 RepID=A0A9P4HXW4_9PEZI|nr:hypothetical protein K490DRAFT_62570 [Saccharata proteae CBS 121410]
MNHQFLDLRDPDLQLHHLDIDSQNELQPEVRLPSPAFHVASLANASHDAHYEASTRSPTPLLKGQYAYSDYLPPHPPPRRRFPLMAILLAIVAVLLVSEEIVFGAIWSQVLEKTYTSHNTFLNGYFGSKIPNFVGALIAGILGLGLQMVLHKQLVKDRITLHLWSFILIFVTYMGCCVAAGVAHR